MKAPFNISIIEPEEYIARRSALPVTTHAIFESSSRRFHVDGFFSEPIFGQIGSKERFTRQGYIDLRTTIINPHLFKIICSLKSFYKDVMAGNTYAVYDSKIKDLVRCNPDEPGADTGYSFFINTYPKLEFAETNSLKRHGKIALLNKFSDRVFIKKLVVIPAALRDIRVDMAGASGKNEKITPEQINKYYFAVLSLSQALPDSNDEDRVFDAIRYQLQLKVQQVYEYIMDLMDGKGGFAQSKYVARSVALANRNVITALPITRTKSPTDPHTVNVDEVFVPLFQAMKGSVPLVVHQLNKAYFQQILSSYATSVPVVNKETLELEYREIELSELKKFTTSDGIASIINSFRNPDTHFAPVSIKLKKEKKTDPDEAYLYLVYDEGDRITIFRNISDLETAFQYHLNKKFVETVKSKVDQELLDKVVFIGDTAVYAFSDRPAEDFYVVSIEENIPKEFINDKSYLGEKDFDTFKTENCVNIDGIWVVKPEILLSECQKQKLAIKKQEILKRCILDKSKIRPLTMVEMFYTATATALSRTRAVVTRYPVLNLEGISPYKIHLTSTDTTRKVSLLDCIPGRPAMVILPEYPEVTPNSTVRLSMSTHPSTLAKYDGDHDGDVLSFSALMSEEAIQEQEEYMENPISMVDVNGELIYGLAAGKVAKYCMFALSCHSV